MTLGRLETNDHTWSIPSRECFNFQVLSITHCVNALTHEYYLDMRANERSSFDVSTVYADALAIHYGLIMNGQRPMAIAIFAYLHIKPLPLLEKYHWKEGVLKVK